MTMLNSSYLIVRYSGLFVIVLGQCSRHMVHSKSHELIYLQQDCSPMGLKKKCSGEQPFVTRRGQFWETSAQPTLFSGNWLHCRQCTCANFKKLYLFDYFKFGGHFFYNCTSHLPVAYALGKQFTVLHCTHICHVCGDHKRDSFGYSRPQLHLLGFIQNTLGSKKKFVISS